MLAKVGFQILGKLEYPLANIKGKVIKVDRHKNAQHRNKYR